MAHKHKWMRSMLGSQVCSTCGVNRSVTGYKYPSKTPTQKRSEMNKKLAKKYPGKSYAEIYGWE